jgi:PAS domain S-box-containing protein
MSTEVKKPRSREVLRLNALSNADVAVRMTAIVESSQDAIIGKDPDGTVVTWNCGASKLFGYSAEEIIGESILIIVPRALHSVELRNLARLRAGEHIPHCETRRLRKDGKEISVILSMSPISNADSRVIGSSTIAREITDTMRTDDARFRLAAIVDSSDDAIVSKDLNGVITSWNKAATRILGYEPDEIVGRSVLTIIPPELHFEEPQILAKLRAGERIDHYETRRVAKDGRVLDVSLTISPVKNAEGKVIGASKILREIGERRRADEARFRLAAIVESSDDAIVGKDLNGIVNSWNAAAERMFGYKPEEIIGRSVLTLIPPELQHEEPMILSKLRAGESIEHYETRRVRKNGEVFDVALTISPIKDASGRVIGASKIARDITERRRADEARFRLAAIVESSDDAIIGKDLKGMITSWNNGATRMFGYEADEIIGRSVLTLIPPELQHEEPTILAKLQAGARIEHYETRRVTKHGRILDVSLTISPIKDSSGRITGASKIARDISHRKAAEAALIEKERLAASGRLAATLAHEVNNPLESIMNLAFLLAHDETITSEARTYADLLLREVQRASEITRQTLGFYRSSKIPGEVHIDELLDAVLTSKEKKITAKAIQVEKQRAEHMDPITGFPGEIRQVFDNLIENAIDALHYGGRLRVRSRPILTPNGRAVSVVICDNGPGIPRSLRDQIFEPFFTTKQNKGSGLGLWVTRSIVHKHHGDVRLRTSNSHGASGTIFRIILPMNASFEAQAA